MLFRYFEHFFTKLDIKLKNWFKLARVIKVLMDLGANHIVILLDSISCPNPSPILKFIYYSIDLHNHKYAIFVTRLCKSAP